MPTMTYPTPASERTYIEVTVAVSCAIALASLRLWRVL